MKFCADTVSSDNRRSEAVVTVRQAMAHEFAKACRTETCE